MTRIDLPDGEWAEFCSPRKVSDRRRRAYMAAQTDLTLATGDLPKVSDPETGLSGPDLSHMSGAQTDMQFHALDLLVLCFLKAWSFEAPISLEAIEDLDAGSKDALIAAAMPLVGEMMPDYSPDPDPKVHSSGSPLSPPDLSMVPQISETRSFAGTS